MQLFILVLIYCFLLLVFVIKDDLIISPQFQTVLKICIAFGLVHLVKRLPHEVTSGFHCVTDAKPAYIARHPFSRRAR